MREKVSFTFMGSLAAYGMRDAANCKDVQRSLRNCHFRFTCKMNMEVFEAADKVAYKRTDQNQTRPIQKPEQELYL